MYSNVSGICTCRHRRHNSKPRFIGTRSRSSEVVRLRWIECVSGTRPTAASLVRPRSRPEVGICCKDTPYIHALLLTCTCKCSQCKRVNYAHTCTYIVYVHIHVCAAFMLSSSARGTCIICTYTYMYTYMHYYVYTCTLYTIFQTWHWIKNILCLENWLGSGVGRRGPLSCCCLVYGKPRPGDCNGRFTPLCIM